jgi:hypothetical protein
MRQYPFILRMENSFADTQYSPAEISQLLEEFTELSAHVPIQTQLRDVFQQIIELSEREYRNKQVSVYGVISCWRLTKNVKERHC